MIKNFLASSLLALGLTTSVLSQEPVQKSFDSSYCAPHVMCERRTPLKDLKLGIGYRLETLGHIVQNGQGILPNHNVVGIPLYEPVQSCDPCGNPIIDYKYNGTAYITRPAPIKRALNRTVGGAVNLIGKVLSFELDPRWNQRFCNPWSCSQQPSCGYESQDQGSVYEPESGINDPESGINDPNHTNGPTIAEPRQVIPTPVPEYQLPESPPSDNEPRTPLQQSPSTPSHHNPSSPTSGHVAGANYFSVTATPYFTAAPGYEGKTRTVVSSAISSGKK
jgi:hypothetical protein